MIFPAFLAAFVSRTARWMRPHRPIWRWLALSRTKRIGGNCELRPFITVSLFARCMNFTWIGFIIIASYNYTRLWWTRRARAERGRRRRRADSAAGCCIPESALMHGLGYVNSYDLANNAHGLSGPLAVSIISNNGASRRDRVKCNSSARCYSPRPPPLPRFAVARR